MLFFQRIPDRWKLRSAVVFFGLVCGIGYQFLKIDVGGDYFLNMRLPLVLLLGILLFYVINYVSVRITGFLLGRYDASIQIEDMKTYLPLCLLAFYPLQKIVVSKFWPRSVLLESMALYALAVLALKCLLVINMRRRPIKRADDAVAPLTGSVWLCMVALAFGIPLFWYHQVALAYDGFFGHFSLRNPDSFYVRYGPVTRASLPYAGRIMWSVPARRGPAKVTLGYRISERPRRISESSLRVRFGLRVTDADGNLIAQRNDILEATDKESMDWKEFELDLVDETGAPVHLTMTTEPLISERGWRYLFKFLLHNPIDSSYFRGLSARAVWSEPEIALHDENRANVILISLDTLRADALGCYGYGRDVSPAIDSFARENIIFENAFSQSTWTLPSHLSMLTSRFPNEFEIEELMSDIFAPRFELMFLRDWSRDVKSFPHMMLPEIFKENRYYCVAFTDGVLVSAYYGFSRGFHVYNEEFGAGGNSFRLAKDWLAANKGKNFFMFIHTYLIHEHGEREKANSNWGRSSAEEFNRFHSSIRSLFPDDKSPQEILLANKKRTKRDWYDVRIRFVDSYIGELFSLLKEKNLYDNTMIIILSDHGQALGEMHDNGRISVEGHAGIAYDSVIRVPFIMKLPAKMSMGPLVIPDDVRLLDVAPTVLAVLGYDANPGFLGRCVLPGFQRPGMNRDSIVVTTMNGAAGSIRKKKKKYIYWGENREEFYDLAADPEEKRNLASLQPEEMLELKRKYFGFVEEMGRRGLSVEDSIKSAPSELRDQLKALGYLD